MPWQPQQTQQGRLSISTVYFTSDLHDGHRNIGKFRHIPKEFIEAAKGDKTLANSLWLDREWQCVGKRDRVIVLGDAAFNLEGLARIGKRKGEKILIGGNHDELSARTMLEVFADIKGCMKYSKLGWLSHFPLHPEELRGRFSLHGHVHYNTIQDHRYINLSCDSLYKETGKALISLDDLRRVVAERLVSLEVSY